MKKLIRLTEGDLHRIISNSVKRALQEMDYKTYLNAGDEARKRGSIGYQREKGVEGLDNQLIAGRRERERAHAFDDAARQAFNRDYGYQDDKNFVGMGGDPDATEEFGPHAIGLKDKGYGNPTKYEYGRNRDSFAEETPEEFFDGNTDASDAYRRGDADLRRYRSGKSHYNKGKGWD